MFLIKGKVTLPHLPSERTQYNQIFTDDKMSYNHLEVHI